MTTKRPQITVLMPVYNGEQYLSDAIQSIIEQTFYDFEFLIIDDGSTDKSVEVINSWQDYRIRLVCNKDNLGLVQTLNKGIELARGKYIARMDCDDISLPHRLELQNQWMETRPECGVIATRIRLINDVGTTIGEWPEDKQTVRARHIRVQLAKANCIAHPSIMMRASLARTYPFRTRSHMSARIQNRSVGATQHAHVAEDYDLWLRLCADNKIIEKIDEVLLFYRTHPLSISQISHSRGFYSKNLSTQLHFLQEEFGQMNFKPYMLLIIQQIIRTTTKYSTRKIKQVVKSLLSHAVKSWKSI